MSVRLSGILNVFVRMLRVKKIARISKKLKIMIALFALPDISERAPAK